MPITTAPSPQATAVKTAQATTGSIPATASASVAVTWTTPFPDATYTVTASVVNANTGEALRVRRIESVTTTGAVVNVINNALTAQTGTVHAIAVAN